MTKLVILLHGVGSNGEDMAQLGQLWQRALPGLRFEAPNAPERADFTLGFQWFSIAGVTPENRPQRVANARAKFDALLESLIRKHGLENDLSSVALVGFSQGTIMSLDAIASGRWPVAGVVGFSGRLASPLPLTPAQVPVLLLHGAADPVIPPQESLDAAARLSALGLEAKAEIYPGLPHTISPEGAKSAARFLANVLKVSP